MGGYAIVAGHMPLACGLALAEQYKGSDRIAVNFLGDGAVNEGEFHEALNLASVWKLPVVFICENNLYGMGTDVRRVSAVIEIYKRVPEAYAMRAEQVDGMDVLAVHEAVAEAAQRARSGQGPVFLEMICYRFRGHSMADAELYRDKDEIEVWKRLDPIKQLREKLSAQNMLNDDAFAAIQAEADEMANEAARFADESADPPLESLHQNVFKEPTPEARDA
jgi:pyruvate dehydrogenase E1 component alpha subunit